jgi:hypothetical protein
LDPLGQKLAGEILVICDDLRYFPRRVFEAVCYSQLYLLIRADGTYVRDGEERGEQGSLSRPAGLTFAPLFELETLGYSFCKTFLGRAYILYVFIDFSDADALRFAKLCKSTDKS